MAVASEEPGSWERLLVTEEMRENARDVLWARMSRKQPFWPARRYLLHKLPLALRFDYTPEVTPVRFFGTMDYGLIRACNLLDFVPHSEIPGKQKGIRMRAKFENAVNAAWAYLLNPGDFEDGDEETSEEASGSLSEETSGKEAEGGGGDASASELPMVRSQAGGQVAVSSSGVDVVLAKATPDSPASMLEGSESRESDLPLVDTSAGPVGLGSSSTGNTGKQSRTQNPKESPRKRNRRSDADADADAEKRRRAGKGVSRGSRAAKKESEMRRRKRRRSEKHSEDGATGSKDAAAGGVPRRKAKKQNEGSSAGEKEVVNYDSPTERYRTRLGVMRRLSLAPPRGVLTPRLEAMRERFGVE